MESILESVKTNIGCDVNDTHFDSDIILHINSVFATLHQMGVGPEETFSIVDEKAIWDDFLDDEDFNFVKTYMYLEVKLVFDPPANSNVLAAMERQRDKLEWRLNVCASNKAMEENNNE